jgi:antitoxin component YwqK of YwqJK toxin-antitoxin module
MHGLLRLGLYSISSVLIAALLANQFNWIVNERDAGFKIKGIEAFFDDQPFSGYSYKLRSAFKPERIATYSNGKLQGTEWVFYPNGKLMSRKKFKSGAPHGKQLGWYESGNPKFLKQYHLGISEGEQWAWHQDGSVWEYNQFKDGRDTIHKTFTFDGKPFHNYIVSGDTKIGIEGNDFCKPNKKLFF